MSNKRPLPQITPGQLQSIERASKVQVSEQRFWTELEASRKASDNNLAEATRKGEEDEESAKKFVPWIARVLLIPVGCIAAGLIFSVVLGLITGEIKVMSRYSGAIVERGIDPFSYWTSVTYHFCLAAFLAFITRQCYRASVWGTRFERKK